MSSLFDSQRFNASLFYPRRVELEPREGASDHRVTADDGARLHLRLHHSPDAAVTLLLFHGNGELVEDYDHSARQFALAGASLAVMDYRGYGASEGAPTLRGCIGDAGLVLAALLAATPGPVVVMGRSLGGACAAELCQVERPRVVGYVFESAPADLAALVRRRGIEVDSLDEADAAVFCPLRKVARCVTPALVLHGASDALIAPREAEATFAALSASKKTLALIPDSGHNDLSLRAAYWYALARFISDLAAGSL